jgi:hypothetical protein
MAWLLGAVTPPADLKRAENYVYAVQGMVIFVKDDPSRFARLKTAPQGWRTNERSACSVFAVVPLVLTQCLTQRGLIPDQRAIEQTAAKVLAPVGTDQRERLISADWPSILGSSYPIAHEHANCARLLHAGGQVPSDILLPHGIHQNPVG